MGFLSLATVSKAPPLALVPNCGECGLLKRCQSPKMAPSGSGNKKLLIIASRPSETADAKSRGRLDGDVRPILADALAAGGVDLEKDCWFTYAQACHGRSKDAVRHCRPLLLSRIKELQPKAIILLGIEAVSSVIGHLWKPNIGKEMDRWAGWTIPAHPWNCWVCPTFDPLDVKEKGDYNRAWGLHFRKQIRQAVGTLKERPWEESPPKYEDRCHVFQDDGTAERAIGHIVNTAEKRNLPVAWDLETNGLKPDNKSAAIACCSMATGGQSIAYLWTKRTAEATREFLKSDLRKIASNKKYEDRWARKVIGCKVKNWWHCTMLAAHLLNNVKAVTSIKFQAFVHLGVGDYDSSIKEFLVAKEPGGYATNRVFRCDWPSILRYCALDSLLEYEVALIQRRFIDGELK